MLPHKAKQQIIPEVRQVARTIIPYILAFQGKYLDSSVGPSAQTKVDDGNSILRRRQNIKKQCQSLEQELNQINIRNKYKSYSAKLKTKIVQEIKSELESTNKKIYQIFKLKSEQYNIHIKNITRWYNMGEIKRKQGGRKALFPEIEEKLVDFIRNNPQVKRRQIVSKAKEYFQLLNTEKKKEFNFSKGWYQRFRARNAKQINKCPQVLISQQQQQMKQKYSNQEESVIQDYGSYSNQD